jgi:hypothetical protein
MFYVDTPTQQELRQLRSERADACVSIYVPTTPITSEIESVRVELSNAIRHATAELEGAGFDKRRLERLVDHLDDVLTNDDFWTFQARALAIFATPDHIQTFRLANRLPFRVEVADRFHLKPLLRAITFPHEAFVIAISENSARLIEVFSDLPAQEIRVAGMPKDAASAVGVSSINNRVSMRRVMGGEGQKVRLTQYARMVDSAIRPVLAGRDVPLMLAANEPLASIYRAVNSSANLVPETISTVGDRSSAGEIGAAARPVLDAAYAREIDELKALFEQRAGQGRTTTDIATAARAATAGAIETLIIDFDRIVHGTVDDLTGEVVLADSGPDTYGVVDEIAGRSLLSGARVLAGRADDVPGGGELAATFRYQF